MPKTDPDATLTVREVTEKDRGSSWKLMMGFYVIPKKVAGRPPKGIKIVRAGTPKEPAPREICRLGSV